MTNTTPTPTAFRTLAADGRMLYPVTEMPSAYSFDSWVTPVTELKGFGGLRASTIIAVDATLTSAEYRVRGPRPAATGYRRKPSTSTAFPEFMSVTDWEAFQDSLGFDDEGDPVADRMYTAVLDEQEYVTESIDLTEYADLPADLLDPASIVDVDGSFPWQVAAPYLVFGDVYAAAMPGALVDIQERFAKAVDAALPGVTIWTHKAREIGAVSGHVKLVFEDRRTYPVKIGRKTTRHLSSKDFSFSIPVPRNIVGASKAAAVTAYNTLLAEVIDQISSKNAVACGHCNGDGVVVI